MGLLVGFEVSGTSPTITAPGGTAGDASVALTRPELQTTVGDFNSNKAVTWSITGGADQAKFAIDPATGVLSFVNAPDYLNPTDSGSNNTYEVVLTATDFQATPQSATQTVTVTITDITAPTLSSSSPADDATGVAANSNIVLNFSEAIAAGTGNISLYKADGTLVQAFDVTRDVTISGATITLNPTSDLQSGTSYYLQIDGTAVDDTSGNSYAGIANATTLNFTVSDTTAPVITGPSGGAGAANSAKSQLEQQTAITTLTADETVTWSIVGGEDSAKFALNASTGVLTFASAPVHASPTDGSTSGSNTYIVQVKALDGAGNFSLQTVTVTILSIDQISPAISGPSGNAGAETAAKTVDENQTAVTTLTADETVTWSIAGGEDGAKFALDPTTGVLAFVTAPDFEVPTDGSTSGANTYIVQVKAMDADGNYSLQTITVTVRNLDDTAPLISGPSGEPGAAESQTTIEEGLTAATTFTTNEPVTWAIDGGSDAGSFRIDPATGELVFRSAPDFETPIDSDRNNTYVVRVKAMDAAGNVSYQTLTVIIGNVDEIARRIDQISDRLRTGLRTYAVHGLSDMLSFNEELLRADNDNGCNANANHKDLSGSARANQAGSDMALNYAKTLSKCGGATQIKARGGMTYSRMAGNWNARLFASLQLDERITQNFTIGAEALTSFANGTLISFDNSGISDKAVQAKLYGRYKVSNTLQAVAFAGIGKTWYDFDLRESDGFTLAGDMSGNRQFFGGMLSGVIKVGGVNLKTDAIVSRAVEKIGNARLSAHLDGQSRSGIAFAVGSVDVTRISVPVSAPVVLFGSEQGEGGRSQIDLSSGLLCEDNSVETSALQCGYQLGAKLLANDTGNRNRFYADAHWESVNSLQRLLIGFGFGHRFGDAGPELALEANSGQAGTFGQDNSVKLTLRMAQ